MLYDHGQQFFKMQKQTGAFSCFKSQEKTKGDYITFGLKQA